MPPAARAVLGTTAAVGTAALGWGLVEARSPRLRRVRVPVLPAGAPALRVLHLTDLHMTPGQRWKQEWVRGLAALEPDLVVDTGDNLAHAEAVPAVLGALEPLLERPGAFVLGSNDYYAPGLRNPLRYLLRHTGDEPATTPRLPTGDLVDGLVGAGWLDLTNARGALEVRGVALSFAGVDDPHLSLDAMPSGGPAPDAALHLGVTHAPYLRVLHAMAADGAALVLAGHTHGGQVCLPGGRALVTNCDLDRRRARGLSRWDDGRTWLHVSAGLGTNPFTPVRVACPPEATLLELVPLS